jgi:ABC-type uncharacterized transport system involved in gliding motility auxiliary subunit
MQQLLSALSYVGIALIVAGWFVRGFRPEYDQYARYAVWIGLALMVAYVVSQWREIVTFFRGRNARYGALATTSVVAVLGILVAVNWLSNRRNTRWDLTENQRYSLSDQTVRLLEGLEAPVQFLVFDQAGALDAFRPRMTEYAYHSDLVEVEYIDADRDPVRTQQYEVQAYGTVVITYMGRVERVVSDAEQELTNGLIKLLTGEEKRVYFIQGHGERDTGDSERGGYSQIAASLARDNYAVEPLVLAQQQTVPEDAAAVVLAGPRTDLLQPEADRLAAYLDRGGHLLVLLDPPDPGDGPMPVLGGLLEAWAVSPGDDIVVDVSGMGQLVGTDASTPLAVSYPSHAITDRFNLMTAYPLARSISAGTSDVTGRAALSIIQTSQQSWAETNVAEVHATGQVEMNADSDTAGPVSIGVAVSAPAEAAAGDAPGDDGADDDADAGADDEEADPLGPPESRLVVIGDSDFAANYALGIQGNQDLFMNTVSWLAQQENLISIRPRDPSDRRLTLTARSLTAIFWLSLVGVPAGVLGTGVYAWWRRRG